MGEKTFPTYSLPKIDDDHKLSLIEEFPENAQLLGEITGRWSLLEFFLSQTLSITMGIDKGKADIILNSLSSFQGRLNVIRNSVIDLVPEMPEKTELLWLLDKIRSAYTKRNDLIHALYAAKGMPQERILFRMLHKPGRSDPYLSLGASEGELKRHSNRVGSYLSRLAEINSPFPEIVVKSGSLRGRRCV